MIPSEIYVATLAPWSLHDAEPQVDYLMCLDHFDRLQRDVLTVQVSEQWHAAAE